MASLVNHPGAPSASEKRSTMPDRLAPVDRLHVLVVEDEANIRTLVCSHLESEGHSCLGVANGQQALDLLRAQPFDVVVLDIMLPGLHGLAVCRIVRGG